MSAPERIWADMGSSTMWSDEPISGTTEYARADLLTARDAEIAWLKAEVERLREDAELNAICDARAGGPFVPVTLDAPRATILPAHQEGMGLLVSNGRATHNTEDEPIR